MLVGGTGHKKHKKHHENTDQQDLKNPLLMNETVEPTKDESLRASEISTTELSFKN